MIGTKRKNLLKATRFKLLLLFLVVFTVLASVFSYFEIRSYRQRKDNNLYLAENQVQLISGSIDTVMSRAYTLRELVKANAGSTDFFDAVADDIVDETLEDTGIYVKNIILAPDGVVEKIYPMTGNEALLGFDYMDESQAGNAEAIEAYKQNKLVLTNPFSLKQGGTGFAGRLPVYIVNDDGESEFWGMVSVTLDMDYLLKQFNLSYLENAGVDYCLYYESDGEKNVIASNGAKLKSPVSCDMTVSNITWTLEVSPSEGWLPMLELCVGYIAIFAISFMLMKVFESAAKIRSMNAILKELAIKDNLTGCYSRHYVTGMLLLPGTTEWRDSASQYSMAIIDIDYFKQINDKFGHDMGDKALVSVSKVLQDLCDELRGDCIIRYGGDEFIYIMNMNHADSKIFESKVKQIIEDVRQIRVIGAPEMRLTVSIGAVAGDGTQTYYELFSAADKMVYKAKNGGRDRYTFCAEIGRVDTTA